MSIVFERQGSELILTFSPERISTHEILEELDKGNDWRISRCFVVDKDLFRGENSDDDELYFCVGTVQKEYTYIDSDVLVTDHNFYFANNIKLQKRHFVAYRNISILAKIDEIVDQDVYIGGNREDGFLPIEAFELLIKKFPKTAELDYYAQARISAILKEFYPYTEQYEQKFRKYIDRQDKSLSSSNFYTPKSIFKDNAIIELEQFSNLRNNLNELLHREQGMSEDIWQAQVYGLLRLLYPKYIAGIREVVIKGVDRHDKRPDFLLIDSNGYVDILEIKKPSVQFLTKQSSYRNNYVPVRELAGAIQQIEKYIYCLNAWGKDGDFELQTQLKGKLPPSVIPKIVNPQGLLLLGRSDNLNRQQKDDFELIKRQYKHIAEIMTYDDLLQRIDNIIAALFQEVGND